MLTFWGDCDVTSSFGSPGMHYKIFELNVKQSYLKLRYEKGFTWQARGQSRLYLLCDTVDVQYFCCVREDTATALFDFCRHKNCTFLVNKVLFLISICCHQSVAKIVSYFWALITTALPLVPPGRIKIKVSMWRETTNKSHHP